MKLTKTIFLYLNEKEFSMLTKDAERANMSRSRHIRQQIDNAKMKPTLDMDYDKSSGHCFVKVDIYFTGVGMICIPTEEEVIAMIEEARKNPQEYRIVA